MGRRRFAARLTAAALLAAAALAGTVTPAGAAPGYYRPHQLVALTTNQCLTANTLSFAVTDRLYTARCARDWNPQLWDIVPAGGGYSTIRSRFDGRCLDVYSYRQEQGARVVTWTCIPGATNQQWVLIYFDQDGGWRVLARHSGKCLHSTPPWLAQYDCTPFATHQTWAVTN